MIAHGVSPERKEDLHALTISALSNSHSLGVLNLFNNKKGNFYLSCIFNTLTNMAN